MDANPKWIDHRGAVHQGCSLKRWESFGPYYAMFPVGFARKVIETYTAPGDLVLDPFCGRGTAVFCAAEVGRNGLGIEINPVGWLYASAKMNPPRLNRVLARLESIAEFMRQPDSEAAKLPKFFRHCFCADVLSFLLACRRELRWQTNSVDRTLMAFVLCYLHGRIDENGRPQSLSNQMRQTKSMSQQYSMRWWRKNGYKSPPRVKPHEFLKERLTWRYKWGSPEFSDAEIRIGDAQNVLPHLPPKLDGTFKLLLTSPPYSAVTSYYFDQWLRLWMLGFPATPSRAGSRWKGRFENRDEYRRMLARVFQGSARLLSEDSVVYVRTDARQFTMDATLECLREAFPKKKPVIFKRPFERRTQTALFGDSATKPGEVDIVLQ